MSSLLTGATFRQRQKPRTRLRPRRKAESGAGGPARAGLRAEANYCGRGPPGVWPERARSGFFAAFFLPPVSEMAPPAGPPGSWPLRTRIGVFTGVFLPPVSLIFPRAGPPGVCPVPGWGAGACAITAVVKRRPAAHTTHLFMSHPPGRGSEPASDRDPQHTISGPSGTRNRQVVKAPSGKGGAPASERGEQHHDGREQGRGSRKSKEGAGEGRGGVRQGGVHGEVPFLGRGPCAQWARSHAPVASGARM